jgi:hypothetical protein
LGGLFGHTEHGADLTPGSATASGGAYGIGECPFRIVLMGCMLGDDQGRNEPTRSKIVNMY